LLPIGIGVLGLVRGDPDDGPDQADDRPGGLACSPSPA